MLFFLILWLFDIFCYYYVFITIVFFIIGCNFNKIQRKASNKPIGVSATSCAVHYAVCFICHFKLYNILN